MLNSAGNTVLGEYNAEWSIPSEIVASFPAAPGRYSLTLTVNMSPDKV